MRVDVMHAIVTAPPGRVSIFAAGFVATFLVLGAGIGAVFAAGGDAVPRLAALDGPVAALLELEGSTLVAGGNFSHADGVAVAHIAHFGPDGWNALGDGFDAPVRALAVLNGALVAGGDFTHSGAVEVNHVALWNGSAWEPLGGGTDGPVHALCVQANVILYAAGDFTTAGGLEAHAVARWIVSWSGVGLGLDGAVHALALYNGNLVAGGEFTMRDPGSPGQNLARFASGVWRSPALGLDGPIYALAEYNGALVMAGDFSNADTVTPARNIAGLISDWNNLGFGIGTGDSTDTSLVRTLEVVGGDLVAGGEFGLADLQPVNFVARFDGAAWHAMGDGTNGVVRALVQHGGFAVAGGDFTTAGGAPIEYVAAFDGQDWQPLVPIPIAVEDLAIEVDASGSAVLRWRLAPRAVTSLGGIVVQRAREAAGPWSDRSGPMVPAGAMQFRERFEPDAAWYRLLLFDPQGRATPSASLMSRPAPPGATLALHAARDAGPGEPIVIEYELAHAARVRLDLFDIQGRLVRQLATGTAPPGRHLRFWDRRDAHGRDAARGVYILQLRADGRTATRKLVIARR